MSKVAETIKAISQQGARQPRVIIMGAGMSGILMGIRLLEAGLSNFTIYEKSDRIGGTWRENTYPGIACDIPSYFYTYSFEVNPNWSRRFPPGDEIQQYFERVFDKYKLAPHTVFNEEITHSKQVDGKWHIETASGINDSADFLVAATGILHKINQPEFEGLDTFEGAKFHTARWDHNVDLNDKKIGIIGSGSTAIQTIDPLSKVAAKLTLFQRTAQWVFPLPDKSYSKLWIKLTTRFPILGKMLYRIYRFSFEQTMGVAVTKPCLPRTILSKLCRWNLSRVKDPELRAKLTPDYLPGCKRLVMSMPFYAAIQKPNCAVVTEHIDRIEAKGVRTKDGQLHELDVLVLATGFDGFAFMRPMSMQGLNGLTLEEAWKNGPQALRAMAIPGFPNFFMLIGPHSPIGNHSLIAIAETQTNYIMQCIEKYMQGEFDLIEPTQQAVDDFYKTVNDAMPNTIWTTGCNSWYLDDKGIPGLWPWSPQQYTKEMQVADFSQYRFSKA
jgi:cation diffusion facilitator CzcD-associated flavoprotein CzcO